MNPAHDKLHCPKGIIFDLDGTLVDSLSLTFEAFNHGIVHCGSRPHTPDEITAYFGTGEDRIFAKLVGEDRAHEAYTAYSDYLDEHMGRIPLHAEVSELLDALRNRSIPISIVTGRSWNTTELILKHHELLDRFVTVIANDHVSRPKPAPEGILLALSRMGLKPEEAFYVGDSTVDILAARAAGSRSVAALWDFLANQDTLEAHSPHRSAASPSEVLSIWNEWTTQV